MSPDESYEPVFPVALRLADRQCLVVGSGPEAVRRTRDLLDAGARVRLLAGEPDASTQALAADTQVTFEPRRFEERDLDGVWLAVLAKRDPELAAQMGAAAARRQVLFCAVDQPRHGSFSHMARARAGAVQAAVTTAGQAPSLARRLAEELQRLFDAAGLAAFADSLAALRGRTPSSERAGVLGAEVADLGITGKLELGRRGLSGAD